MDKAVFFASIVVSAYLFSSNAHSVLLIVSNSPYLPDEFQHAHIIWNIMSGERIYVDFFEHHGQVYYSVVAAVASLLDFDASVRTMVFMRYISVACSAVIVVCAYLLGAVYTGSKWGGVISAAILSSTTAFGEFGCQIRPDPVTVIFWVFGIYLLARSMSLQGRGDFFLSGVVLGLVVLSNMKMVVAVVGVALFFVLSAVLGFGKRQDAARQLLTCLSGASIPIGLTICYYAAVGGLGRMLFCLVTMNVSIFQNLKLPGAQMDALPGILGETLAGGPFFGFLCIAGVVLALRNVLRKNTPENERRVNLLVFCCLLMSLVAGILLSYRHNAIIFLPLLSVFGSNAVYSISKRIISAGHLGAGPAFACLLLISLALPGELSGFAANLQPDILQKQNELLVFVLNHTSRDEPILWWGFNGCGGFQFNSDPDYYWEDPAQIGGLIEKYEGFDPFKDHMLSILESGRVIYVISPPDQNYDRVAETDQYILANYRRSSHQPCLLIRKY